MYINVDFKLSEEIEKQIEQTVKEECLNLFIKNPNELRSMVKTHVKGCIGSIINELLQTKDYKQFLKKQIEEQIGLNNETNEG